MAIRNDLGAIITFAQGHRLRVTDDIPTIIDNGCFSKSDAFTLEKYRKLVADHPNAVFATVPDVVGDWAATLRQWDEFPKDDWPVSLAIVLQDGATGDTVPWDAIGAVFVGGTTEWKLGPEVRSIVAEANRRKVWAHMGRVNSLRRLRYANGIGCDSVDGTHLVFKPDAHLRELTSWLDEVNTQRLLFEATG